MTENPKKGKPSAPIGRSWPFTATFLISTPPRRWAIQTGTTGDEGRVVIILMGVAGAGKTTVGRLLAKQMCWEFADGDDYHSEANVQKMSSGIPLTDADRAPWLAALRELISGWIGKGTNGVLACSALKREYREALSTSSQVRFVYLKGSPEVLRERMHRRAGHFMTERMLASQLATLEEPDDANAIVVDTDRSPMEIVEEIRRQIESIV